MRSVWAAVGTVVVLAAFSCSSSNDGDDSPAGGSNATGGAGGGEGGAAGDGAAGNDGAAGDGGGGESVCECSGDPNVPDPEVHCVVPLELFCPEDDPVGCATTLFEAASNLLGECFPGERYGTRADCGDGTIELEWIESELDSGHRLVFDELGMLVGRYFYGAAYGSVHSLTCGESGSFDLFEYEAGELPTRECEPTCSLCEADDLPLCTL